MFQADGLGEAHLLGLEDMQLHLGLIKAAPLSPLSLHVSCLGPPAGPGVGEPGTGPGAVLAEGSARTGPITMLVEPALHGPGLPGLPRDGTCHCHPGPDSHSQGSRPEALGLTWVERRPARSTSHGVQVPWPGSQTLCGAGWSSCGSVIHVFGLYYNSPAPQTPT